VQTPFLKEAINNLEKNSVLVLLNQKQLKPSINFVLQNFFEEKKTLIFVSTQPYQNYFEKEIPKNIFVINLTNKTNGEKKDQIFNINNPSNLTGIQIAVESVLKKNPEDVTIFFDSINSLAIHNSPKNIAKFFYIFINKTSLQKNSLLLFSVKDSMNENALDKIKQFSGKTFDYSNIFISSIEIDN
jgi:hypothetical protein